MAKQADIRSLQVRPIKSADLAFPVDGIIAEESKDIEIGHWIDEPLDTAAFYASLRDEKGANHSEIQNTPSQIALSLTTTSSATGFLCRLQNEPLAVELERVIAKREQAFLERFQHREAIKSAMEKVFAGDGSVQARIERLMDVTDRRATALLNAYERFQTNEDREKTVDPKDSEVVVQSVSATKQTPLATRNGVFADPSAKSVTSARFDVADNPSELKEANRQKTDVGIAEPHTYSGDKWRPARGGDFSVNSQEVRSPNPVFSHPKFDTQFERDRLTVDLLIEQMERELASHRVPDLERILLKELSALDSEVQKVQTEFSHTFLLPPFPGRITAKFKDVGESVRAGEPVLRVEDDQEVYLVGRFIYSALLKVGDPVVVTVNDLYESGVKEQFSGNVVAVRGHDSDNDEWEALLRCPNPFVSGSARNPGDPRKLPINYAFDRDGTTLTIGS